MKKHNLISSNIELFYNKASEEDRLSKGMGVFEFQRIKYLISLYLKNSSTILDIGGGTGKYSEWLSKLNHNVYLVEPVDKHLKMARDRSQKLKNKFKVVKGESRNLDFPNNFADLIILHGPLYHLQNRNDRIQTINEAKRVLKQNGVILGFGINATASTLVGLLNGLIYKPTFIEMCKSELTLGIHNPPEDFPWLLAEAFYHKPSVLKDEFLECNLKVDKMFAVEGFVWLDKDYYSNMLDPKRRAVLDDLLMITENDESLLPFSPHMMIVAKK
ncbi:class I SAM-dependent methyltransferase [Flavobacterium sp. xlx-214]|uniref:class I SAM-dependent methyltransferase n=1 Tax=unclassified Flavobacterium TaxID=196869 RepID=UPI0013CF81C5|nr:MULTISPECIES: class I SAM-dependent methyltransferase [unclassified Flavobacterium]MBA5791696.1 class I SAM-dependent methyltransferase [Flavobacterium sp. xlx-221]QMI82937.1 class I SAM-dependent methyltransferase [Flavobacterium sp. xlx-214]